MVMRTMQENKAEIFRRAQVRIEKRRAVRRRVTAIGIPVLLGVGLLSVTLLPPRTQMDSGPQQETYQAGSIVCTYVRAEVYAGDESWTVTDKVAVTKIFEKVFDYDGAITGNGQAAAGHSAKYQVVLFNEDGTSVDYTMTEEQWQALGLDQED